MSSVEIAATPMLRQYREIKSVHQDCILFFRLGDFYEMFYEDARDASRILELVLTSRGSDGTGRIPMCGVPYHSADNYIARLIKAGRKVAICEQVEDPSQAKGIVKREVVRVITAGTFQDDNTEARFIMALAPVGKGIGFAFTDTASGAIMANELPSAHQALEVLAKLPVYECIYPEKAEKQVRELLAHPMLRLKHMVYSAWRDWSFESVRAQKVLTEHFGTQNLRGFGIGDLPQAQSAAGALVEYLKDMNRSPLRHLDRIALYDATALVFISPPAHYGLELESLLKTLDQTSMSMGRRLFRSWLYHPLKDPVVIRQRQDAVSALKEDDARRNELVGLLRDLPDLEKSLSRMSCATWAPRDLLMCRQALGRAPLLKAAASPLLAASPFFGVIDPQALRERLEAAVNPEMPLAKNEGKVIRRGYHAELDELKGLEENAVEWLQNYQIREVRRTGINSLKVGFNRVFGYYIEISNANLKNAPSDYTRKQTLTNGERFITPELKEYEHKILTAQDRILKLEAEIMAALVAELLLNIALLHRYAREAATLDVLVSLATLAARPRWVRPQLEESRVLHIEEGRHPVVEELMSGEFIPNDTDIDGEDVSLAVLTGPNMAGKSTYIRQNAVLVIMAQMGSFVPARAMRLGCVDKIFTRIGAHDEISKGQSTFMVEMTEAADILNNVTERSLVILDEIGRGTSTYDGLSLAWAIAEFLADRGARTFFATHFHELTLLADRRKTVRNYNVQVREWEDRVIFMHRIVPGGADDSYGIYVAKLAGMPAGVLARAKKLLAELEFGGDLRERLAGSAAASPRGGGVPGTVQPDLFSASAADPRLEWLCERLESLDVNHLTPMQALQEISDLKRHLEDRQARGGH